MHHIHKRLSCAKSYLAYYITRRGATTSLSYARFLVGGLPLRMSKSEVIKRQQKIHDLIASLLYWRE